MWTSLGGSPKPRMTPCQPRIKKDPGPWLTKAGLSKRDDYYSLPNGLHQQPQKCFYLNPGLTLMNTTKTQQKHNKNTTKTQPCQPCHSCSLRDRFLNFSSRAGSTRLPLRRGLISMSKWSPERPKICSWEAYKVGKWRWKKYCGPQLQVAL